MLQTVINVLLKKKLTEGEYDLYTHLHIQIVD